MKTILLLSSVLGFTLTGCASEKLRVTVVDDMGIPVSNASVFQQAMCYLAEAILRMTKVAMPCQRQTPMVLPR